MTKLTAAALAALLFLPLPAEARSFNASVTYYSNYFNGRKMASGRRGLGTHYRSNSTPDIYS